MGSLSPSLITQLIVIHSFEGSLSHSLFTRLIPVYGGAMDKVKTSYALLFERNGITRAWLHRMFTQALMPTS